MKITFFIGSLYGGGAERVTCNIASYLAGKGHQVEILTMSQTDSAYELDERVSTRSLLLKSERRKNVLFINFLRVKRLCSYLHREKKDAYVVMLPLTIILFLLLRFLTKAKVVVAERADPNAYPRYIQKLLRWLSPRADGFIFQTEDAKQWYSDVLDKRISAVIPNAINPVFIRVPYSGEKEKIIVSAGRLTDQKNFSLLIEAFSEIADSFPQYNLTIYGEGKIRQQLENQIAEKGLEGRVHLPGNVCNIAEEIEKISCFVLSSNFEGMPNALMEAMALGLPCISTDCPVGGPRFLIENGVNGLLVPVGDEQAMAEAMRLVLSDAVQAEKLGRNAMEIRQRLAPDVIYGRWENFILRICEG